MKSFQKVFSLLVWMIALFPFGSSAQVSFSSNQLSLKNDVAVSYQPISYTLSNIDKKQPPSILNQTIADSLSKDIKLEEIRKGPRKAMLRSLMIPGWGQATNKQYWKIPLVYALIGGVGYNVHRLTVKYHDYRAAFYNLSNDVSNGRFGPTKGYLADETNATFLKDQRDQFRINRDQMVLYFIVAYGVNVLDAFIYAHFKTFDVSDDLSLNMQQVEVPPIVNVPIREVPAVGLKISF